MAVKYLSGLRITGTEAERTALTGSQVNTPDQNQWQLLDRAVADNTSTELSTGTFTTKGNLLVLIYIPSSSNNHDPKLMFNGESGTSSTDYHRTQSVKDNNYYEVNDSYYWDLYMHGGSQSSFYVGEIFNRNGYKHTGRMRGTSSGASGNNATARREWYQTYDVTDQIDEMKIHSTNGNFPTGTEIVVLGMDDNPSASGTNYLQELGVIQPLTSAGTMSTPTFADKNYLYAELFSANSSNNNKAFFPNADSSSSTDPCTFSYSANGGEDTTTATRNAIQICVASTNDEFSYTRCWICNHHDKEKLFIVETVEADGTSQGYNSGAGAPQRSEFSGKWTNTSVGITKLNVSDDGGTQNAQKVGSTLRVWGND